MFSSRIEQKTQGLAKAKRGESIDRRDVEYLLDAIPYIRQYTETETETESVKSPLVESTGSTPPTQGHTVDSFVTVTSDTTTGQMYDEYLAHVEGDEEAMHRVAMRGTGNKQSGDIGVTMCQCGTPLRYAPIESVMLCTNCGKTEQYFEEGSRGLNYHEQIDYSSKRSFTYKRISHFIECLNASQAKQNTSIPEDVLDAVKSEMKKYRIPPERVSASDIRKFLKRCGLVKYYEHVNYILSLINHTKRTTLPKHVEETLIKMFIATQQPFESVTDNDRVNFLRYNYIIYKMLEIIGETEYLEMFPLLKSRNKLIQHDQVWKRICEHPHIGWPFIPTI